MPTERSYGNILRSERERSGYDLTSMSRRLHIRPDILKAIENGDFDRMPARGYSKNMVRAYARALKLDEQTITNMFLDEVHLHESGMPRRSSSGSRSSYGAGQGHSRRQSPSRFEDDGDSYRSGQRRYGSRSPHRNGRDLVEPEPSSRGRTPRTDAPQSPPTRSRSQRSGDGRHSGIGERFAVGLGSMIGSFTQGRGRQESKVPRSFNTIGSTPPYARNNSGSTGANGMASMNLPMVLAIIAAIIVLLIVVVVISNGSKQASEDVPDIPISGLTDTSSPEDEDDGTSLVNPPEFATFKYSVKPDMEAWIEIYEDGEASPDFAEVVEGPAEESFEVRGSLTIRTAVPEAVVIELDGTEVEFEESSSAGMYYFAVDFEDILDQWNKDHGRGSSSSSSSSSTSSRHSSSGSSSSSSSSASSSSSSSKSSSSSSSGTSRNR